MDAERLRVLLDPSEDLDVREVILLDLCEDASAIHERFPEWAADDAVLDALTQLASDPDEELPVGDAAEALVWVWMYKGWVDRDRYERLLPGLKQDVRAYIEINRPDLLDGVR